MFRLLHLADVHLDTTFLCRTSTLRIRLKDALREAVKRAVDCAIEEDVHAVLIAGDLFDNGRLSFATERFLIEQLKRLDQKQIPCFYTAGNHDPGGRTYRGGHIEWPESFHYVSEREPTTFEIHGDGVDSVATIVGAGHATARESTNIARVFPKADGRNPHIGLLHSYVTSAYEADSHDRYAPCSLEDLRRPGYKYWALGHIHRRQQVCEVTEAWYPGNIQGRNPRETGPKGGLLVTLDGSAQASVEFRSFAPVQWLDVEVDNLDSAHTLPALQQRIRSAFESVRDADSGVDDSQDFLVRVTLSGRTPLAGELRSEDGKEELEELLGTSLDVLDVDVRVEGVTRPVDIEKHRGEPHLLGAVLSLIEEAEYDSELLQSLAPDVLARTTAEDPDETLAYLRRLFKGLDAEAAARLVREG